jgi:hypothetical protein
MMKYYHHELLVISRENADIWPEYLASLLSIITTASRKIARRGIDT